MHDTFRPLSQLLTAREMPAAPVEAPASDQAQQSRDVCEEEAARELRLFKARVEEGVRAGVAAILTDVATVVLARELELQPADIGRIVERACTQFAADHPARVRVHPLDAAGLPPHLPVEPDASLRAGDAVLELRCGYVDATLGARLASILPGLAT